MANDYSCKRIKGTEILDEYNPESTVILVTPVKDYEEIIIQLNNIGFYNCYSLLIMESNLRATGCYINYVDNDFEKFKEQCNNESIDKKKVIFRNMGTYSGHGKYITEKILEYRKDLDIVWLVNKEDIDVPQGVRLVDMKNIRGFIYEMETAHIWIMDYTIDILGTHILKRNDHIYIQVKHWSSITLKSFGTELDRYRDNKYYQKLIDEGRQMDYLIVGSEFDRDTFRRSFDFQGETLMFGSARSDILFNDTKCRTIIEEKYNLQGKKIALFAPTFRDDPDKDYKHKSEIYLDYLQIKSNLDKYFGGEWIIMLRLHPQVAYESRNMVLPNFVMDASEHIESQELVAACDIMITDYSSIMFEPAFVNKPVFLFAPDRKEYINVDRELLIDYDTLPFPIAETNDELVKNIAEFDNEKYISNVDAFMEKYGVHEDGHASERAAKFISALIDNGISDEEVRE